MILSALTAVALLILATDASRQAEAAQRACLTPDALLDLGSGLPWLADRIARREPVTIVAIGSSSTAGAGASEPRASYPARLAAHWPDLFPASKVTVINRGVNGEEAKEMMARFERNIAPAGADLILWRLGVNAVLRWNGVADHQGLIADGIAMLKATGADVVLVDLQYAPKVSADPDHLAMGQLMKAVANDAGVGLFQRFAIMRHWQASGQLSLAAMISGDGPHLTDQSYDCWAVVLVQALARALPPTPLAGGPQARN